MKIPLPMKQSERTMEFGKNDVQLEDNAQSLFAKALVYDVVGSEEMFRMCECVRLVMLCFE